MSDEAIDLLWVAMMERDKGADQIRVGQEPARDIFRVWITTAPFHVSRREWEMLVPGRSFAFRLATYPVHIHSEWRKEDYRDGLDGSTENDLTVCLQIATEFDVFDAVTFRTPLLRMKELCDVFAIRYATGLTPVTPGVERWFEPSPKGLGGTISYRPIKPSPSPVL